MTEPVSIQQRIRILDAQGVSWREIARRLGVCTCRPRRAAESDSLKTGGPAELMRNSYMLLY